MVIQRWQSLLLFVALILMACYNFSVMATVGSGELVPTEYVFLWVPAVAAALLLFIDIFLYKNLKLQMRVAVVSLIVILAVGVSTVVVVSRIPDAVYSWFGAPFYIFSAIILTIFARYLMGKDLRLLRSVDRLR